MLDASVGTATGTDCYQARKKVARAVLERMQL